jgi:hypothetical protein
MTLSGKTTKAKALAHDYRRAGIGVLVLDPLQDPGWQADFITDDPGKFLDVFWKSRSCMAFMDEGGESVGRYDLAMQKTATRGRHCGHVCHYVTQKATQLAPVVRDQCTRLFLFCSSTRDGKILADEFNRPELEGCSALKQGEYFYAVKMGTIQRIGVQDNGTISDGGGPGRDDNRRAGEPRTRQRRVRPQSTADGDPEEDSRNASDGGVSS